MSTAVASVPAWSEFVPFRCSDRVFGTIFSTNKAVESLAATPP